MLQFVHKKRLPRIIANSESTVHVQIYTPYLLEEANTDKSTLR